MRADRQSPSAAYVPTQMKERIVIRSEERTRADLRSRSSGLSDGRGPAAAACATALLARSGKLMGRTLDSRRLARCLPSGWGTHWRTAAKIPANRHIRNGLASRYPSLGGSRVRIPPPPSPPGSRLFKRVSELLLSPIATHACC